MENQNSSRTIILDIARLIKLNKISEVELKALDKETREKAISLASELKDELVPQPLRKKPLLNNNPEPRVSQIRETPVAKTIPTPPPPKVVPPVIKPKPVPKPTPVPPPKPAVKIPTPAGPEAVRGEIENKLKILEQELSLILKQKNQKIKDLEDIVKKEKDVEAEEERIKRNIDEIVSFKEKRALEEERWKLEDRRQELERERFTLHEQIDSLNLQIPSKKTEIEKNTILKKEVEKEISKNNLKKDIEKAKIDLQKEEETLKSILEKKAKHELVWIEIKKDIENLAQDFVKNKKNLDNLKNSIENLSRREKEATTEQVRHKLEEERWSFDKLIRETETLMWKNENLMEEKKASQIDIERIFVSIQTEEEQSENKIASYKNIIDKGYLLA